MDDDDLGALAIAEAREKMVKAVDHARAEFSGIRTGRATPPAAWRPAR
jgi:ribosome recycling factor